MDFTIKKCGFSSQTLWFTHSFGRPGTVAQAPRARLCPLGTLLGAALAAATQQWCYGGRSLHSGLLWPTSHWQLGSTGRK